ncbi:MAG: hypothetical protein M1457_05310 [bacterium]|nr:hypothetical protein [bacterium]
MIKKLCLICILSFCLTSYASAITITVAQAGGADQTTILGALAAANSGDVIQINDSATYSESLPDPINTKGVGGAILDSLTIQVAAGMTPTIENTTACFNFGPGTTTTTVTGPFVIQGASNTARLTLRSPAGAALVTAGMNATAPPGGSHHAITVANVNIVKPSPSGAQWLAMRNTDGPVTVTNVTCTGGDAATAANFIVFGWPGGPNSFTGTNIDVSQIKAADGSYKVVFFGGTGVFNNCNLTSPTDNTVTNEILNPRNATTGSITFNNCAISPGIRTGALTRRISVGAGGPIQEVFNNCTFGKSGEVPFRIMGGELTKIAGSPTAKTDLSPMIDPLMTPTATLVTFSVEGTVGGDFTLQDVNIVDTYASLQMYRNIPSTARADTVTLTRCFFKNITSGSTFNNSAPSMIYNINNTIWMGARTGLTSGSIFNIVSGGGTSLSISLLHSTFIGGNISSPVALYWFHNHGARNNFITANYCIFDDRQMGAGVASFTHSSLAGNISLCSRGSFLTNGGSNPIPPNWIVGTTATPIDPKLTATGRLTDLTSPAIAAGVGSFSQGAIDIDGNNRPLNNKDLGASQTPFPNAASGWTEFK